MKPRKFCLIWKNICFILTLFSEFVWSTSIKQNINTNKLMVVNTALSPWMNFLSNSFFPDDGCLEQKSHSLKTLIASSDGSCSRVELSWWLEQKLKEDWIQHQLILLKEDQQKQYHRIQFTGRSWMSSRVPSEAPGVFRLLSVCFLELTVDELNSFSSCSGLDLIFGLNALLRNTDNSWNSSNARSLLQYCESKQYKMSWELGNGKALLSELLPKHCPHDALNL